MVSTRTAAFRKSRCSVISPTGSVSYTAGAGLHPDAVALVQALHRLAQVCEPVPHVGAQPEPGARQRETSTDTSSTGSGIGGSGLVARTTMPLAPKRSSSMSATAVQTRSSVRYERSVATSATAWQTAE